MSFSISLGLITLGELKKALADAGYYVDERKSLGNVPMVRKIRWELSATAEKFVLLYEHQHPWKEAAA